VDTTAKSLEELVRELSPDMATVVRDFIEFFLSKQERRVGRLLQQDWAGALRDYREQYKSVELQYKASDWRDD
jgi:hypothetical protein